MGPLHVLLKPASGLCDLQCKYCFYVDEMNKREVKSHGMMTEETLKNVIVKALEEADREITFAFQGGEPTLRGLDFYKKALELQKCYNYKNLKINNALQTNGYHIEEDWCRFFSENNFLIGLSIDGTIKTHDANRKTKNGELSYLHVLHTASLLQKYHVEFNILTVVNRQTAPKIRKIYQDYYKREFYYQQYIACLDPLFEDRGKHEYSLTPQMYGDFLEELFQLWYDDLLMGRQPYIRQFENYISILAGLPAESCEQNGICGYQNVVEADGSVYPCDFYVLDDYCLGNLNEHTFLELKEKQKVMQFVEKSVNQNRRCRDCRYFSVCRGGCNRHRIMSGEPGTYENYYCQSYLQLFDSHYEKMKSLAEKVRYRKNTHI